MPLRLLSLLGHRLRLVLLDGGILGESHLGLILLLLSDVDGLYDRKPSEDGAVRIPEVRDESDLTAVEIGSVGSSGVGTGGMQTKVEAARIATGAGIPALLAAAPDAALALAGAPVGTLFHPTGKRRSTRLLWLAHATEPRGRVVLDDGAVLALTLVLYIIWW